MKHSLRTRLLLTTTLLMGIVFLLTGVMTYQLMSDELLRQTIDTQLDQQALVVQQLNGRFDLIIQLAHRVITDEHVQDFLKQDAERTNRSIKNVLLQALEYYVPENYIESIVLVTTDGRAYGSRYLFDDYYTESLKEEWFQQFLCSKRTAGFSGVHTLYSAGNSSVVVPVVSYIMDIRDIHSPKKNIGTLIVHVKTGCLLEILENASETVGELFLTDENYQPLFGSILPSFTFSGETVELTQSGYYLNLSLENQWCLIRYEEQPQYLTHQKSVLLYFGFFGLCTLSVLLITMLPVLNTIIKPIGELTKSMQKVSDGDLYAVSDIHTGDEMEVLSDGFNQMLGEIRQYIDNTIEQENEQKRLQTQLMLAQINPHFIYNTLNAVIYLASQKRSDDIEHMTREFIYILRHSVRLSESGMWNTVEHEIEMTKHYLEIMRYRFSHAVAAQWFIDDGVLHELLPRSILQPIVENALYHGLLPKNAAGALVIEIFSLPDGIRLKIKDDGVGMNTETLAQVLRPAHNVTGMNHIGVYNIQARLQLLYGDEYLFNVTSQPNLGTTVEIFCPKQQKI